MQNHTASSLSLDLYALAVLLHLTEITMSFKALHKRLDGMKIARLHNGRVVVALLYGLPDLCWGLAELVQLTHVFWTVCGQPV